MLTTGGIECAAILCRSLMGDCRQSFLVPNSTTYHICALWFLISAIVELIEQRCIYFRGNPELNERTTPTNELAVRLNYKA